MNLVFPHLEQQSVLDGDPEFKQDSMEREMRRVCTCKQCNGKNNYSMHTFTMCMAFSSILLMLHHKM